MDQPDDSGRDERDHRSGDQSVRDATVVFEANQRSAKAPEDVEVGGFGSESHGQRGVSSLAVEAGASEAGSGHEMGDWVHRVRRTEYRELKSEPWAAGQLRTRSRSCARRFATMSICITGWMNRRFPTPTSMR